MRSKIISIGILSALFLFFATFLFYPLSYAVILSCFDKNGFTFEYFRYLFSHAAYRNALLHAFGIGALASFFAGIFGFVAAWCVFRYRFTGKKILSSLLVVPLLLPPFVGALGVKQILGRFGSLNLLLMGTGVFDRPIDFLGEWKGVGVAFIQALHLFPLVYLALLSSLFAVGEEFEEAAALFGASSRVVFLKIIFPLLLPSILSALMLCFVGSLADVGTPLLFQYHETLSVKIFHLISEPRENPVGYALIVAFTLFCAMAFFGMQTKKLPRLERRGRGFKPYRAKSLNSFQTFMVMVILFLLLFFALFPHLAVFLISISESWFMTILPARITGRHFVEVLHHPLTVGSLKTSLFLSSATVVLAVVLAVVIAFFKERKGGAGGTAAYALSLLPLSVPGVVLAFGYLTSFQGTILDVRLNPIYLLIIAYTVRRLPYVIQSVLVGLQEGSRALEDAARVFGASPLLIIRKVTVPLMKPHLLSGALLCFLFSLIEVSDSLILALEDKYFPVSKALYALSLRPDGYQIACALAVVVTIFSCLCVGIFSAMAGKDLKSVLGGR